MTLFLAVCFAGFVALVFLGVLTVTLDQRRCAGCGSESSTRYPEHRVCHNCGRVW
jgi:hypothetical protein